jgi:hypothetical protein
MAVSVITPNGMLPVLFGIILSQLDLLVLQLPVVSLEV